VRVKAHLRRDNSPSHPLSFEFRSKSMQRYARDSSVRAYVRGTSAICVIKSQHWISIKLDEREGKTERERERERERVIEIQSPLTFDTELSSNGNACLARSVLPA